MNALRAPLTALYVSSGGRSLLSLDSADAFIDGILFSLDSADAFIDRR